MPGLLEQGLAKEPQIPQGQPPPQPGMGPGGPPPGQPPPQGPPMQPTPSSGPATPPAAPPAPSGANLSGSPAGPEQPAAPTQPAPPFEELRDEAIRLVYDERFDQLIKMFENNGPKKFARSMAIAVTAPIGELEKKYKDIPLEDVTKIGLALYTRLLEDMIVGKVVEGVTDKEMQETIPAILVMYSEQHPEIPKEEIKEVFTMVQQQVESREVPEAVPGVFADDEGPPPTSEPAPAEVV